MKIKQGDQVMVMKGKDRGKKAKVMRGFPALSKVLIEGVNVKKVHKRPKKEGEKGQVVTVPFPLDVSRVKLVCPKCSKPCRVGYKLNEGNKVRVCKKCKAEI